MCIAVLTHLRLMTLQNTKPERSDDLKLIDDLVNKCLCLVWFLVNAIPQTSRVDLIAFDSPFVAEPWQEQRPDEAVSESGPVFERAWGALQTFDTRGWSATSVDGIIGRLQDQGLHLRITSSDKLPFEGACWKRV